MASCLFSKKIAKGNYKIIKNKFQITFVIKNKTKNILIKNTINILSKTIKN